MKRSSIKRKRRRNDKEQFAREYGSKERVEWVWVQPCIVPGCRVGPCLNSHIKVDGTGRKSASTFIVPLCVPHDDLMTRKLGKQTFQRIYKVDLAAEAIDTELRWQQHLKKLGGVEPLF